MNFYNNLYLFHILRVECKCGLCGPSKHTLNQWERHTGCKAKKWKISVKDKETMLPLWELVCTKNIFILNFYICFRLYLYINFHNSFQGVILIMSRLLPLYLTMKIILIMSRLLHLYLPMKNTYFHFLKAIIFFMLFMILLVLN